MEKITIEGNLGKDPGYTIAKYPDVLCFSVGVAQGNKEEKKPANWYNVAIWKKELSEELVLKLKKGSKVIVTGKPILKVWNDATGSPKGQISINGYQVTVVEFDDRNADGGNTAKRESRGTVRLDAVVEEVLDDDIPF